jgi:hypothetical protein
MTAAFPDADVDVELVAVYTLRPFTENGTAVWDIAVCRTVRTRSEELRLGESREHSLPQPIEVVASSREARDLRARLGPGTLDWSAFEARAGEATLLSPTVRIQQALRLVQVIEALMKSLEIYPVEVISSSIAHGKRTVDLRAKPDNERDRFAKRIGMSDTVTAIFRHHYSAFGKGHGQAAWQVQHIERTPLACQTCTLECASARRSKASEICSTPIPTVDWTRAKGFGRARKFSISSTSRPRSSSNRIE